MPNCTVCGRELNENEICECSIDITDMKKDYFRLSVKRSWVDGFVKLCKTGLDKLKAVMSEKDDEFNIRAVDGRFENGLKIVDQCVVATDQEKCVRQYDIACMHTPLMKKAYGRLQVTNKRVIFRAAGRTTVAGPIITEKEFALDEVGGIDIKNDYRFSWLILLLSFLAVSIFGGLYTAFFAWFMYATAINRSNMSVNLFWPGLLATIVTIGTLYLVFVVVRRRILKTVALTICASSFIQMMFLCMNNEKNAVFLLIVGAIFAVWSVIMLIISGIVDDLQIEIKIKGGHDAISISRQMFRKESSGFMIVKPWRDTNTAMQELGALIDDVRRLGDAGIQKWNI